MKESNGDIALGTGWISFVFFFQNFRDKVKHDLVAVFREFHYGQFEKSLNAIFIFLIHKKSEALEEKDFRPIILMGGVYKHIAKVLANRFRMVLGKIISFNKNFRCCVNSLDSRLKAWNPQELCKLDLEKAYNHVNWGFLLLSFAERWLL